MTPARPGIALLALPAALFVVVVFAVPMAGLGRMSFNETGPTGAMVPAFSFDIWRAMIEDSFTYEVTLNSMWLSFVSTTAALALAYPLALFLFRTTSRWKGFLIAAAITPMLVSGVVRVFGWLAILGDRGFVNWLLAQAGLGGPYRLVYNFTGAAIGLTESLMPYMILALIAGFGRLDRTLEEASASLGASPLRTFVRVTLPLSLPAIVLGWLLCFVLAMSAYVTPKLLGGGRVFLLATEIYDQAITTVNWPMAAALAMYMLVLLALFLAAWSALDRRASA